MQEARLTGGACRAAVAVGAVFVVAASSAGEARADGPIQLKSRLGDYCLDAPGGNIYTPPVTNPCNGTDFQRWNVTGSGQLESVAFPGACLTHTTESLWAHVQPCVGWPTQQWTFQPDGLVKNNWGGCLSLLGGPGPGTRVTTRGCGDAPDQQWDSVP